MKSFVFAFLFALFLLSCDDAPEAESVNTLGTDVQVSMAEYFEPGQRTLSFKFLTQKDFPCINYRIKSEYRTEGQEISIVLSEVEGADVCLEAMAPAASFIDLGELASGDYSLTIRIGESLINTGTLSVTESSFALIMDETIGLIVETPQVLRIPKDVIWGRVRSSESATAQSTAQNIVEKMQRAGAVPRTLPAGNYGYFTVDQAGNVALPNAKRERVFLLDYPGEAEAVLSLLNKIVSNLDENTSVSLHTTTGDEL